jgi:hypothetical protein
MKTPLILSSLKTGVNVPYHKSAALAYNPPYKLHT